MTEKEKRLVEDNLGLVHYTLKLINAQELIKDHCSLSYDDLYQEGCMGLMSAAEKYDDTKGCFSTLAVVCIKNRVLRYMNYILNPSKALSESSLSLETKVGESDDTLLDLIKGDEEIKTDLGYSELKGKIISIAERKGKKYKDTANLFIRSVEEDIPISRLCPSEGISRKLFSYRLTALKKVLTTKQALLYTYL